MASLKAINAGTIMAIGIGVYFLAAVLPGALTNFFGANTTTWDASSVALWALIPLAIVASVVLFFVPRGGGSS